MAYQAGDQIKDDEYNAFVGNSSSPFGYNHFAGTGATVYGLGQTELALVDAGATTITAAQWNGLWTGMINIANHTNDTLTARTAVTAGDVIAVKSAVAADLATLAASVAAGCPSATALSTSSALQTATGSSEGWDSTHTQVVRMTFANANNMRFFFNAGGKIRITVGTSQSSTSPKDQSYIDLGTAFGNIDIASLATTRSGSGETLTTNNLSLGFQDLTTSYQTIIKLTSDNSNYTSNNISIDAKTNGGNGNSGDATSMDIRVVATDGSSDAQYTSPNTSGVAGNIKDTPKIVTTLFAIDPTTAQGLDPVYIRSATSVETNP